MRVRVKLIFPEQYIREPIIARMVREFDIEPNIRRASVEETYGWIVLELGGDSSAIDAAVRWLGELGIEVEPLGDVVES